MFKSTKPESSTKLSEDLYCSDRFTYRNRAMKRSFDASEDTGANDIHTGSSNKRRNLQSNGDPLGNFVIVVKEFKLKKQNSLRIISDSCTMSRMAKQFEITQTGENKYAKLFIHGQYIATGEGRTQKEAKDDAHDKALKILSQRYYTIKIRLRHEGGGQVIADEVPEAEETPGEDQRMPPSEAITLDTPIEDSSVGSEMLKMMGRSGGGFGNDGLGVAKPVRPSHVIGFGSQDYIHLDDQKGDNKPGKVAKAYSKFGESLTCLVNDFLENSLEDDLVFSPEFTPDQRCTITE